MRRNVKQKVIVGAAVAVVLGGGAFAAVSATGHGDGHGRSHARRALSRLHQQDLLVGAVDRSARRSSSTGAGALALFIGGGRLAIAATDYLAVTPARLRGELRSGRTLAQIAGATPGKSSAGLVRALLAVRRQRLAHALATGKVTAARAARRQSRLQRRMRKLIQHKFVRGAKP